MPVSFQRIPGAGLVAPITTFEVNSGGQFEANVRLLLIGHKNTGAALADNTPTPVASVEDAIALCGAGSMLYEMYRVARANAPAQEIWIESLAPTGTTAAWTLTVGTPPAAGGVGVIEIAGRPVSINIVPGDDASVVAAALNAAINAAVDPLALAYLPVTSTVATNVVTVTARHAGAVMNELEIVAPSDVAGNAFVPGGRLTIAQSVTATGAPTLSNALATLGDDPFDWIVSPFADATSVGAAATLLSDLNGRWAWDRQIYGHYVTVSTGNLGAQTSYGLALNDRHLSAIARVASPTPSWEWVAGYVARTLPWLSDDATGMCSVNQSDLPIAYVRPPRSRAAWWTYAARNTLLKSGMTTWTVNAAGQVTVDKFITMQRLGPAGQPDVAFRDIQRIAQVSLGLRRFRAYLQTRNANKSIARANPNNLPSMVTIEDIRADCVASYADLVDRGLFEDVASFAKRLVVAINQSNPSRVDIGMDMDAVNPLDILAANATIYSQFSVAA